MSEQYDQTDQVEYAHDHAGDAEKLRFGSKTNKHRQKMTKQSIRKIHERPAGERELVHGRQAVRNADDEGTTAVRDRVTLRSFAKRKGFHTNSMNEWTRTLQNKFE